MSWLTPYLDEEIFLGRDGSQMEIRMLAQQSQDKLLCQQLNTGEDIHPQVAHSVFGWSIERVKKEKKARVIAKQLHFGIIFGLKDEGIFVTCKRLGIKTTVEEIREKREAYFRKYKGVAEFIEYCIDYAEKHERTIPNLFGMSRDLNVTDQRGQGSYWKNQAVNTPIQGSAAQFLIYILAIIKRRHPEYNLLRRKLRDEVHDAFYATPKLRYLRKTDIQLQNLMETVAVRQLREDFGVKMLVPLKSEAVVGFRFGTLIDYESGDVHLRDAPLEKVVELWVEKNQKVEKELRSNPLKFIDLQRGK